VSDIPDSHIAFARELVALARKHSMNHLRVEFDHSGTANWQNAPDHIIRIAKTHFLWEEGRHGARTRINMSREETAYFEEIEEPTP